MTRPIYAGLDIETSASNFAKGRMIQFGLYTEDQFSFVSDCDPFDGWHTDGIENAWEEGARAVNGFSNDRVAAAPPTATVDARLCEALNEYYGTEKVRFLGVGWNVGSFDLPFVVRELPGFASKWLSYRSVDLNAVVFTLDRARRGMKGVLREKGLKAGAKQYATEVLTAKGVAEQWHDALYDARAALLSWEWLSKKVMVVD